MTLHCEPTDSATRRVMRARIIVETPERARQLLDENCCNAKMPWDFPEPWSSFYAAGDIVLKAALQMCKVFGTRDFRRLNSALPLP